jgi:hypothetical protein
MTLRTLGAFAPIPTLSALLCAAPQDEAMQMPKPAPELAKYEPMLGAWEGSGEFLAAPDVKPTKWNAEASVQWALGKFFVEEKLRVTFAEGQPPVVMHNFYGYDNDTKSYRLYGASNRGSVAAIDLSWTSPTTLVGVKSGHQQGKPYAERWISRFGKDGYDLKLDVAIGDAPFFTKVNGKFTRAKTSPAAFTIDDAQPLAPAATEHKKLESLIGTWKVKGTMTPAPGAPSIPISGVETIGPALGGSLLRSHTVGDPTPGSPGTYENFAYYTWDASDRAYDLIYVSNMGEAGKLEGRFTPDGALVWTSAQPYMGQPSASRCVQTFEDGTITFTSDRLFGTNAAVRDFTAEYSKSK